MIKYRVILTRYKGQIMLTYMEDDKPLEIRFFRDDNYPIGTIFLARVSQIQKNIDATFLELPDGSTGFLPGTSHTCGSFIPVQLLKDGTKTKAPRFTDELSVAGRYAVGFNKKGSIRGSSKWDVAERKRLLKELKQEEDLPDKLVVLRTNALSAGLYDIVKEIRELAAKLDRIEQIADKRTKSVLYRPAGEWVTSLLSIYTDKLDEIVTDDRDIYAGLSELYPDEMRENMQILLRMYEDDYPLYKLYALEKHLKEALEKRVWLKCGGFLVIEQTEALVSIDVNSAKIQGKTDKENTFLTVNLEAAKEIARQVRLRNLSGIILIDFINMEQAGHGSEVLETLRNALLTDPVKCEVHGFTSLGLLEMTRMKGRKTLYEQTRYISDDEAVSGDKRSV